MKKVIKQRRWTQEELEAAGFKHYPRKKQVVMVRRLSENAKPMAIQTDLGDTLFAPGGYFICYHPGDTLQESLADYEHWPVEPQIFAETYSRWDEELPRTPPIMHLLELGCRPFFKAVGVWAKSLEEDTYIQAIEHKEPVRVDEGRVMAIGSQGEPYHMSDQSFHNRYDSRLNESADSTPIRRVLRKLVNFFKNDG